MNNILITEYRNAQHYVNDRKVMDNETAITYDGAHADIVSRHNNTLMYERLDNNDLRKLLDIDYKHDTSLVDKLEMLLPSRKRRSTRKHRRKRMHKHTRRHTRTGKGVTKHKTHKKRSRRSRRKHSKTRTRK